MLVASTGRAGLRAQGFVRPRGLWLTTSEYLASRFRYGMWEMMYLEMAK